MGEFLAHASGSLWSAHLPGRRSDHQTGTRSSKRGVTPVIPGTGQRFPCNMMSAITNRGSLAFRVFTESFTIPVMIRFLGRLIRHAGRKVFLIVDGYPVHKSAKVRRWLAANIASFEMFMLPAYSPDMNPDEYLNQDVKSNALGCRRPASRGELIAGVRSYLRGTQRQQEIVKRYFRAKLVRYAA